MRHFIRSMLVAVALFSFTAKAPAFSLMGPFASWQTTAIGYQLTGDIGGPMNLGEEYRVTVPVLTYGFDATFLNFFGSNGVAAVTAAMNILNTVPAASAMSSNLAEFPLQAVGPQNGTAAILQVLDLKSAALSTMLGQMGLASPERWVFALRDRTVSAGTTNYLVIPRHFDPVTLTATNVVNGVLYTYTVRDPIPLPNYADAVETPADGRRVNPFITVASVDDGGGLGPGQFFTSLTRDDYGALRYLLRFNNVNVETLDASVSLAGVTSPYAPVTGTNTTNLVGTNVAVATARRPGIDRISFNGMAVDALLNIAITPVTNRYTDQYYMTNSLTLTNQVVQRVTTIPDVLFLAGDLTQPGPLFVGDSISRLLISSRWVNNSTLNTVGGGGGLNFGPGVIPAAASNTTAIVITFSSLGPSRLNSSAAGARFLDERSAITNGVWGYFDTTTIFSVFPDGLTIQDLERQLYGR